MTKLVVRLLGGFRVELDGNAIHKFESDKCRALLAYLVVEAGRPHRRETLASLLWPDRPDTVARANLRQALSALRRTLTPDRASASSAADFLFVTPTDVQFNTASDTALDISELQAFTRPGAGHARPHHEQLLPEAFCGDFLAGFALPDSETFQAWVLDKQEHYHRLTLDILDEQAAHFEEIGDYGKAVAAARLQLRMEPWLEEAHRCCMWNLALAGRRDEALHQYELCCRSLEAELATEPSESTRNLYAEIREGRLVAYDAAQGRRGGSSARPVSPGQPAARQPQRGQPQGLPLLAGREDELGALARQLNAALAGETGIAFVSGDPGSGKTTLLEAFAGSALAGHPDLLVAAARCAPGGSVDPFAPLRRLGEMLFGDLDRGVAWRPAGREEVDRLGAATDLALACLQEHGPDLVETLVPAASIARRANSSADDVRGSPSSQRPPPQGPLSQGALSQGALSQGVLFDQLLCTLAAIAAERPLLLLLDDLHWVDDATAAFLLHLGRELSGSRLLVLGAYRPEPLAMGRRDPATGAMARHPLASAIDELRRLKGEIVVDLDRADGRAFIEAYVDREPNRLGARFRDALHAQTGGHALFTVELLRNLQERGELLKDEAGRWVAHESLDWGRLPSRVEAAIAERIERLPEQEREILAVASVQGDDFTGELVAEVAGRPVREVIACLSASLGRQHHLVRSSGLSASENMPRAGSRPASLYRFTHHLFQKYLYDQLDAAERGQLHVAIAAALDRQAGDDPAERERLSAQLAWHYEAGGMPLQAARALHDAGRQATRVAAFRAALDQFEHGLALLAGLPPSPERAEIARLLEMAKLGPQRNLDGLASASLAGALAQASQSWAGQAEARPALTLLWGQAERQFATAQYQQGLETAERMREQATQWGEETFVALAHWRFGTLYHGLGELAQAERHLGWVLDWLTPEGVADARAAVGLDLEAATMAFSALDQWFLGYPDTALARSRRGVAGAAERGDAYGQAFASAMGCTLLFLLRDDTALAERVEQCYNLSQRHGFRLWQAYSAVFLGRLAAARDEVVSGVEQIQSTLAAWLQAGMTLGTDSLLLVLADTCLQVAGPRGPAAGVAVGAGRAGLLATGLEAVESMIGPGRVRYGYGYPAELYRMRGELLLARDGPAAAEPALECFETALRLAGEHGLRCPELRAAMSLVRLRQRQGAGCAAELAEARARLAGVVARFTEGFGFSDLQEAATLIGDHPR